MRTKVCFAPRVIDDLSYYPGGGRLQIRQIELLLEEKPLIGREYVHGIPAIRLIHRLFVVPPGGPHVGTLAYKYLFLPLADFIPKLDTDEIIVFEVGRPVGDEKLYPSPHELREFKHLVTDIYHTVKITV